MISPKTREQIAYEYGFSTRTLSRRLADSGIRITHRKFVLICFIMVSICIPACKQETDISETEKITIDFNKTQDILLSKLVEPIKYIKVGHTERGEIIYPYKRLSVLPDLQGFILFEQKPDTKFCKIFYLNDQGEVLCQLDEMQGPNSLSGVTDVRYYQGNFYSLKFYERKLTRYDLDCNGVQEFELPETYIYFHFVDQNKVALDTDNRDFPGDLHLLNIYDLNTNAGVPALQVNVENPVGETMERFFRGENLLFFKQHDNFIYEIGEDDVRIKYELIFAQDVWIDEEAGKSPAFTTMVNEEEKMFKVFNVFERGDQLLFFLVRGPKNYWVSHNSHSKETNIYLVENDIDGLDLLRPSAYGDEDKIVFTIPATEFAGKMKQQDLTFSVDPNDNDYLAVYKLKFGW